MTPAGSLSTQSVPIQVTPSLNALFRPPNRKRLAVFAFLVVWLCAVGAPLVAGTASEDPLLRALKEEMERSKTKLKMEGVAAPYYIEYRVTELDDFEANAAFGALRNQQRANSRFLRVVVRIGDYKQDSYYGTGEGTLDLVPLDNDEYAIRHRIWLATDRAYKTAAEALSAKQSVLKTMTVDQSVDDFTQVPKVEFIGPMARLSAQDFAPWVHLLEETSGLYRADPLLEDFESSLRFLAKNTYFVNSEGSVARYGTANYAIYVAGSTQASDGQRLQRSHQDEARDLNGLPAREQFLKTAARLLETLRLLRSSPLVDEEYRGPVLFSSDAGSSVVAALIAPNLFGTRPKLGENARTTGSWSSSYKMKVLPPFINVFDDPTISSLHGHALCGSYAFDDEAVKAQRVTLIEKGQLVSYLMGRVPIRDFPASNGHGRAAPTGAAVPAPGNLILESTNPQAEAELERKLLDLARQRDLPYALYVETVGPGLEPRLLYRIHTSDGRRELVRGGAFGDLDVRSLRSDLIATGTTPDFENHLESIPYSVASPALLFGELQVKRTQVRKQALPEYPAPAVAGEPHDSR